MSTIASGSSSVARTRPSASSSRPSASVLWISTVLPPRIVRTSPSFIAEPDGMLSVHIRKPVTVAVPVEGRQRRHRRQHGGGAGHVHLHRRVHRVGRLEADAAGVVHHALADQGEVARRRPRRPVRQLDDPRRLDAAGVDAEDAAGAHRPQVVGIEHLDLEAGRGGDLDGEVGQPRGGEVAGRGVGEVTGERLGIGQRLAASGPGRRRRRTPAADHEGERRHGLDGRLLLQRAVAVAGEQHALDDGLGGHRRVDALDVGQRGGQHGLLAGGAGEGGGGIAQTGGIESRRRCRRRWPPGRRRSARRTSGPPCPRSRAGRAWRGRRRAAGGRRPWVRRARRRRRRRPGTSGRPTRRSRRRGRWMGRG